MSGQVELLSPQGFAVTVTTGTEEDYYASASQEDRVREVFGLPAGVPLPRVTRHSLGQYHAYLGTRLSFPFRALYAEPRPRISLLVRHISVVRILAPAGPISRGILCRVEGIPETTELPLMEIGVREEDPNAQLVDDFAYWFFNYL
jgi:hypothetical protein